MVYFVGWTRGKAANEVKWTTNALWEKFMKQTAGSQATIFCNAEFFYMKDFLNCDLTQTCSLL